MHSLIYKNAQSNSSNGALDGDDAFEVDLIKHSKVHVRVHLKNSMHWKETKRMHLTLHLMVHLREHLQVQLMVPLRVHLKVHLRAHFEI